MNREVEPAQPMDREATVETPMGRVARCQAKAKGSGVQCKRPARRSFRTCPHHGAGTRKRERAGTRQNPALAPLRTGLRARPETLVMWQSSQAAFAERVERYRADRALLRDGDELLARLWACADVASQQPLDPFGLRVLLAAHTALGATMDRVSRIEQRGRRPVMTEKEYAQFLDGVVKVFDKFVAEDVVERALVELGGYIDGVKSTLARPEVGAQSAARDPAMDGRAAATPALPTPAVDRADTGPLAISGLAIPLPADSPSGPDAAAARAPTCEGCRAFEASRLYCRQRGYHVPGTMAACGFYQARLSRAEV